MRALQNKKRSFKNAVNERLRKKVRTVVLDLYVLLAAIMVLAALHSSHD